jgi:FtsH-binding integral membrane protein
MTSISREATVELRKEAYTMGLYVAICLLGALIALTPHEETDAQVIAIIWGVTVGLALAHWFAFRVSATLVSDGKVRRHDLDTASAQLAGAAIVALLASIPVLVSPKSAELEAAELTLAAFIGIVGYAVARSGEASRLRSVIYAVIVLTVAVVIAVMKNALAGH